MKNYDFEKIKNFIKKNRKEIKEISIGMAEDWFWTGETIWEDNKYTKKISQNTMIGGIKGSYWATPAILVEYKNGERRLIEMSKGNSTGSNPNYFSLGCLSSPAQDNLPELEEEI